MRSIGVVVVIVVLLAGCRVGTVAAVGVNEALRPGSTVPFLYGPSLYQPQRQCYAQPDFLGGYVIRCY